MCLDQIKRAVRRLTGINGIDRRVHEMERCQQEISREVKEARHRNDGLLLLVRAMRRKEDWGND